MLSRTQLFRATFCLPPLLWAAFVFTIVVHGNATSCRGETWQGWEKVSFQVDGRTAFLIVPKNPAEGNPWIWRTEFFGHQPQADLALLEHGFHVAYIDVQNLYGAPAAIAAMDLMYHHITEQYNLSKKVVLEGFSRGGLFSLNWAAENPGKVACIYNDAPVCDFKSWPGGKGRGNGSAGDWERCKKVYGFATDEEALAYAKNPVDNLKPLADARIPLLHVCGAADEVVPIDENSLLVQQRYQELGGSFTLISKPHCGHHPHSLEDPTRIVNFVLTHTGFADDVTEPTTPFGYDYFQLRGGLSSSRLKFEDTKRGRVAFLGGSITASNGWRDLVCEDLQRRFPETEFEFISAGIPSLASTPGAFRLHRDVLANGPVDLLFQEAAVNDDTNGFSAVDQVRGTEGIVRQALLANPNIDVVLLHFVDPGKMKQIRQGQTPDVIVNHEKVAAHYQLPSIDLAREVTERIEAGEFTWADDFRDLHPAPFGHKLYARSIGRLLTAAWETPHQGAEAESRTLPPALDPFSYHHGRLVGPDALIEEGKLKIDSGWRLDTAWKPSDGKGTRAGFVNVPTLIAEQPGYSLQLEFDGKCIGIFVASGPDTGVLEFQIDGGDWRECDLFTVWSPSLHLPWAKVLDAELADGPHRIAMRVAGKKALNSQGHAIRIIHFLVNGP